MGLIGQGTCGNPIHILERCRVEMGLQGALLIVEKIIPSSAAETWFF